MDNPNYKQEIKSFHNEVKNSTSSNPNIIQREEKISVEIARVTICLTSNHNECNGKYIDSKDKYFIKCLCECYNKKSKRR